MTVGSDILPIEENRKFISADVAWHYRILPGILDGDCLELFTDQKENLVNLRHELEILLNRRVRFISKPSDQIDKALSSNYIKNVETVGELSQSDVSHLDFLSDLIQEARLLKSSDIHIETYEQKCRIRLRIDGKLIERIRLKRNQFPALVNKIKIAAGLDISEKRLPQDGRIFYSKEALKFDIRVSVLPTLYGEKIVLRLLSNDTSHLDLNKFGFSSTDLQRYHESIRKPSGIVLISGPTGSGKTTTLYGTIRLLNKEDTNILTVEDPIEYTMEGVNQVQVRDDIGLSFSKTLRTFLRQDPDIIMVGEIRDVETANLAIRAALTGHLVLSTIHTNSAWGTISRLIDMGIAPFLISNTLSITVAQRLVRLLCKKCREIKPHTPSMFPAGFEYKNLNQDFYVSRGCKECFHTGYKGRSAIYEVIPVDDQVSDFIIRNEKDVSGYFKSLNIKTLRESAWDLLINGETSVEEIYSLLLNDQY